MGYSKFERFIKNFESMIVVESASTWRNRDKKKYVFQKKKNLFSQEKNLKIASQVITRKKKRIFSAIPKEFQLS